MFTGLVGFVLKLALPSIAAAAGGYVIAVLRAQLAKVGIELTGAQEAVIREQVQRILRRVEEEARTTPKTGPEKLEQASIAVAETTGLSLREATQLIHEELPHVRATFINPGLPGGGRR
jgi:hypothetical protein